MRLVLRMVSHSDDPVVGGGSGGAGSRRGAPGRRGRGQLRRGEDELGPLVREEARARAGGAPRAHPGPTPPPHFSARATSPDEDTY